MIREWYLIDDEGIHPLSIDDESEGFWRTADDDDGEAPWPEFSQVIVNASPSKVVEALGRTAPQLGLEIEEVTEEPEQWAGALTVATAGELTAIAEPGVELEDRVMALQWTEDLLAELRCDGAFFGYDPTAGTLHLMVFSNGTTDFAWCDSLLPGPSYAMVFDDEGRCTDEDPRRFALRMLDMPETSPLLDRYRFVLAQLEELGLDTVSPDLDELPIAAVMTTRPARKVGNSD